MQHLSRTMIVFTALTLGIYVTGLQEDAVSPVFDRFGNLAAGLQLIILLAIAAGVAIGLAVRRRRRLSQLRAATETVERFVANG